jgi:hypothetical protein
VHGTHGATRRGSAPGHDIHLVPDHLASSIYAGGVGAMEGRGWDFGAICERHRESLREAGGLVEALPADAHAPYRTWMDHSRTLLDALAAWHGAAPAHPRNPE